MPSERYSEFFDSLRNATRDNRQRLESEDINVSFEVNGFGDYFKSGCDYVLYDLTNAVPNEYILGYVDNHK